MELKTLVIKARGAIRASEFARRLGVTRQAVYQWEQGIREPSSEMLEKMGIERQFVLQGQNGHALSQRTVLERRAGENPAVTPKFAAVLEAKPMIPGQKCQHGYSSAFTCTEGCNLRRKV